MASVRVSIVAVVAVVVVVVVVAVVAPLSAAQAATSSAMVDALASSGVYDNCAVLWPNEMFFFWSTDAGATRDRLRVGLVVSSATAAADEYVAWGVSATSSPTSGAASMTIGDAVVVSGVAAATPVARDFALREPRTPCRADGSDGGVCPDAAAGVGGGDDVTLLAASSADGMSVIEFERPQRASDVGLDVAVPDAAGSPLWVLHAVGPTPPASAPPSLAGIDYHSRKDAARIDLRAPTLYSLRTGGTSPCLGAGALPPGLPTMQSGIVVRGDYVHRATLLGGRYTLHWSVLPGGYLSVGVIVAASMLDSASSDGWVGLGFASEADANGNTGDARRTAMIGADAILCTFDSSEVRFACGDYTLTSKEDASGATSDTAFANGRDDVLQWAGALVNGELHFRFDRRLITGDHTDHPIGVAYYDVNTGEVVTTPLRAHFVAAASHTARIGPHSRGDRTHGTIDLVTGEVNEVVDRVPLHAWLMWVGWTVAVPVAVFLARFGKNALGKWWFRVHIVLQLLAIGCIVAGFYYATRIVSAKGGHFSFAHGVIGIICFVLLALQPLLGLLADALYDAERTRMPMFPDRIHQVLGWFALLLALVNVFLGFTHYSHAVAQWMWYAYAAQVALIVCVFVASLIYEACCRPSDKRAEGTATSRVSAGNRVDADGDFSQL